MGNDLAEPDPLLAYIERFAGVMTDSGVPRRSSRRSWSPTRAG
jgi:hypothetical protein